MVYVFHSRCQLKCDVQPIRRPSKILVSRLVRELPLGVLARRDRRSLQEKGRLVSLQEVAVTVEMRRTFAIRSRLKDLCVLLRLRTRLVWKRSGVDRHRQQDSAAIRDEEIEPVGKCLSLAVLEPVQGGSLVSSRSIDRKCIEPTPASGR